MVRRAVNGRGGERVCPPPARCVRLFCARRASAMASSPWQRHVAQYRAVHATVAYRDALNHAQETYCATHRPNRARRRGAPSSARSHGANLFAPPEPLPPCLVARPEKREAEPSKKERKRAKVLDTLNKIVEFQQHMMT